MKIKVESEKIIKAVKKLNGIEIVVDLDTEVGEMYNFWNVYPIAPSDWDSVVIRSPFSRRFDKM